MLPDFMCSVTAKTVMRLLASPPSSVLEGSIMLDGHDVLNLTERQMQRSWRRQGLLRSVFMDCSRWRLPGGECGSCFCAGIFCMKSF